MVGSGKGERGVYSLVVMLWRDGIGKEMGVLVPVLNVVGKRVGR